MTLIWGRWLRPPLQPLITDAKHHTHTTLAQATVTVISSFQLPSQVESKALPTWSRSNTDRLRVRPPSALAGSQQDCTGGGVHSTGGWQRETSRADLSINGRFKSAQFSSEFGVPRAALLRVAGSAAVDPRRLQATSSTSRDGKKTTPKLNSHVASRLLEYRS